jgi:hypothetical protein
MKDSYAEPAVKISLVSTPRLHVILQAVGINPTLLFKGSLLSLSDLYAQEGLARLFIANDGENRRHGGCSMRRRMFIC